jgi:succinate dehydrogenase / fumarate reductase, cytochrome b subunit
MGTAWIAATGLLLVAFLLAHLGGVSLALIDPAGFERYAAALHRQGWLPVLEGGLAAAAFTHPLLSLRRVIANRRARGPVAAPVRGRRRGTGEALAAWGASASPWSGAVLLVFLLVHLAQLRWHRPLEGQELAAVLAVLASPWSLVLYLLAGVAVALHLVHGNESAHRSLGLLDPANGTWIRLGGRLVALVLGAGFALLPLGLVLRGSPLGGP